MSLGRPSWVGVERSAFDLVEDAGFRKRNVADTLDELRLGGALASTKTQNKIAYRLRQPVAWRTLVGELPSVWPRWSGILPLLSRASDTIDHLRTMPARSANVEMNKTARSLAPLSESAHLEPIPSARDPHGPDALEAWMLRTTTALADGDSRVFVGATESA
jgi:hypothetical protein